MKILITNDDSINSLGIIELVKAAPTEAEVFVVAPRDEQSGISQAITFLQPLFPKKLTELDDLGPGYSIDGTPADCSKIGIQELCPFKPDLVVSGINGGLNVGVNVCYSGTLGGAFMASTFDIPAIAVSMEYDNVMEFGKAANIAWPIITRLYASNWPRRVVANINIPTAALDGNAETVVVPVETNPLGYTFDKGNDPKGRPYFWANNAPDPEPSGRETDCTAVRAGKISISPVSYNPNEESANSFFENAITESTSES